METLKYGKILAVQKCLNAAVKGHTSPEQNRRNLVGLEDVSSAASSLKEFILFYFLPFTINMKMRACARKTCLSFKVI